MSNELPLPQASPPQGEEIEGKGREQAQSELVATKII